MGRQQAVIEALIEGDIVPVSERSETDGISGRFVHMHRTAFAIRAWPAPVSIKL